MLETLIFQQLCVQFLYSIQIHKQIIKSGAALEDTISSLIYRGARKTVCNVTGVSELWKKAVGEVLARHKVFMPVGRFETPTSTMFMAPANSFRTCKIFKIGGCFLCVNGVLGP